MEIYSYPSDRDYISSFETIEGIFNFLYILDFMFMYFEERFYWNIATGFLRVGNYSRTYISLFLCIFDKQNKYYLIIFLGDFRSVT